MFRISVLVSIIIHIGGIGILEMDNRILRLCASSYTAPENNIILFTMGRQRDRAPLHPAAADKLCGKRIVTAKSAVTPRPAGEKKYGLAGNAKHRRDMSGGNYIMQVRRRIEEAASYPVSAQGRGIDGKVTIIFSIDKNGMPYGARIVLSSGYTVFDEAAKKAVYSAAPFRKPERESGYKNIRVALVFRRGAD